MVDPREHRKLINWDFDARTAQAAAAYPLPIQRNTPAPQFAGRNFDPHRWDNRVLQPAVWPRGPLISSPEQIILQFQNGYYLQALAMVVSWGTMWRRPDAIWGHLDVRLSDRQLMDIDAALRSCAQSIEDTLSIANAWTILTGNERGQLGWSAVITSKTLHFLCRSLGFQHNPPVAIDNAVILNRVWPAFVRPIRAVHRPLNWRGSSFGAYCRYMTAISTWADQRTWTTSEMEATLFEQYLHRPPE